jgi:tripartite-type tricarboxylate transporter receptor subunit TctC
MPSALVEQLNGAIRSVLNTPPVRQKIQNFSADIWLGTPQELEAFIRSEVPAIQALARKAGIEPE